MTVGGIVVSNSSRKAFSWRLAMTTMEEIIADEARSIKKLADADCFSLKQLLDGIKIKADNILRTLEEGDPDNANQT
jgi:hypothetical protein